jgi:hypothetical protein
MKTTYLAACACITVLLDVSASRAQLPTAPAFTVTGELLLPSDYREWVFVGTGLGMTYGPNKRADADPAVFDNVYVPREAYRAFMQVGTWPEQTILVMEGRASDTHQLLANTGQAQGEAKYIEAAVKDSARFRDTKWGYFNFGSAKTPRASARKLATSFDCYTCHVQNTAVENTFVQFYPALFEVAKRLGTVKSTYDPSRKF